MTDETTSGTDTAPEQTMRPEGEDAARSASIAPEATRPSGAPSSRAAEPRADGGISAGEAVNRIRSVLATAVFTVAVLGAVVLALGATLVALDANTGNVLVSGVLDLGYRLVGPFADVFTFADPTKQILVNWGIAAVVFLIVGRVVERVIRP